MIMRPRREFVLNKLCQSVVLSHEHGMHCGQGRILNDPSVSCQESPINNGQELMT
jgi:hypothetical protein